MPNNWWFVLLNLKVHMNRGSSLTCALRTSKSALKSYFSSFFLVRSQGLYIKHALSLLIIAVTISLYVIGALASLFFINYSIDAIGQWNQTVGCNRTPVIRQLKWLNHTKSTQLSPSIAHSITTTIANKYKPYKTREFPKWSNFLHEILALLEIFSELDGFSHLEL